ncbi:MAG: hypothetical protein ACOVN0_01115 [Niveispirillum sp.]|uniref:hypothetical protein n=1 Tax=Niveispirillum sp. TaxID=1917217 RepID=UPI003BA44D05
MEQAGSIFDDVDEARKARAIEEARADVAAGRVVPHAVVAQWLERLAKGERPPPPYSHTLPRQD